jgi:hypothetical protein
LAGWPLAMHQLKLEEMLITRSCSCPPSMYKEN